MAINKDSKEPVRQIVVIETGPMTKPFQQLSCLMSDEELAEAKKERPDLIFRVTDELPSTGEFQPAPVIELGEDDGITVTGMTLPYDLEEQSKKIIESAVAKHEANEANNA